MDIEDLPLVEEYADILQIGSRMEDNSMAVYDKLKSYGLPIVLESGITSENINHVTTLLHRRKAGMTLSAIPGIFLCVNY